MRTSRLLKQLRTKSHYFMLLDCLYSFLEQNNIPFEEFEVFVRKDYKPNDELISKLIKLF